MNREQHNRMWGTSLGVKKPVPSQREYVKWITGYQCEDNFKAYWLLQQARKPSARALKRMTPEQQCAVQKLMEYEASGGNWEHFKFCKEWGIDIMKTK